MLTRSSYNKVFMLKILGAVRQSLRERRAVKVFNSKDKLSCTVLILSSNRFLLRDSKWETPIIPEHWFFQKYFTNRGSSNDKSF